MKPTPPAPSFDRARALDAEQALIGAAMLDSTAVVSYARKWGLGEDALIADPRHTLIWNTILTLESQELRVPGCSNVDPLTVTDHLRARNLFDAAGGTEYLTGCVDKSHTTAHTGHYVQIIHELHLRQKVDLAADHVKRLVRDPETEPHTVVSQAISAFSVLLHRPDTKANHEVIDAILATWSEITEAARNNQPRQYHGIPIGFPALDDIFSGIQPGLNLLAGLPSAGKTSLAVHALLNVAKHGIPCAAVMMDITTRRTFGRMLANMAGVSLAKINKGNAYGGDWAKILEAAEILKALNIHVLENEDDYDNVASFLRVLSQDKGVRFFIGDYIQLLEKHDLRREPEQYQIKQVTRGMKKLSYTTGLAGLWLAQFNRSSAKDQRAPRLDDLHGASALEKEATTAMLLYEWNKYPYPTNNDGTPDHMHPDCQKKRRAVVVEVAKQQDGETGTFPFWFRAPYFQFEPAPERWGLGKAEFANIMNPPKPERKSSGGY